MSTWLFTYKCTHVNTHINMHSHFVSSVVVWQCDCVAMCWYNCSVCVQVVKHFLKLANDKASAAREESEQAMLQEVEDLDQMMTRSEKGECREGGREWEGL